MPVTVITTADNFFDWLTKTNQLITQYNETNTLAVNAYNTSNAASFTAANISSAILIANTPFMNAIVLSVASSNTLINAITSNTIILGNINNSANTTANTTAYDYVTSPGFSNTLSDYIIAEGTLTAAVLANTTLTDQVYLNANSIATAFNANSNLGIAWRTGNSAFIQANTSRDHANVSYAQANTSSIHANAAFAQANVAYDRGNTAYDHANAAYARANTGSGSGTTIVIYDDSEDVIRYPVFANTTSGNASTLNVSSTGLTFNPSTGAFSAVLFNSLSDETKKTNIYTISDAVWKVNQLRGVQFNFIESGVPSAGILAQDLVKILPELVSKDMSVNYSGVIGLLVEAIKELSARIEELENK